MRISAGGYVRSVAHELGQALGSGAHLASLRRIASGPFTIEQAIPLAGAESLARESLLLAHLPHPRTLLPELPSVTADEQTLSPPAQRHADQPAGVHARSAGQSFLSPGSWSLSASASPALCSSPRSFCLSSLPQHWPEKVEHVVRNDVRSLGRWMNTVISKDQPNQ